MAQIIVGDKSKIKDFPFEDEVHDMGDFIFAHPDILGPEVSIIARELQVPTVAGQKRLDFLASEVFVCTEILPQHIPSLCRAQTRQASSRSLLKG
jgi:hypothetical protein